MSVMKGEASLHVDAPPDKVYALVSDVTRMGEWSPETVSCEWIGDATGPTVGAKFKGRNKDGIMRWSTTPEVTAVEPGREFAFRTAETVWRYVFEPDGGGTKVTESFDVVSYPRLLSIVAPAKRRQPKLIKGIETTLQRLKVAAEA